MYPLADHQDNDGPKHSNLDIIKWIIFRIELSNERLAEATVISNPLTETLYYGGPQSLTY